MTNTGSTKKIEKAKKAGIHTVFDKPVTNEQIKQVFNDSANLANRCDY